jgi:hypothetical protein
MAYLSKTEDRRYDLTRYRVRYRIYFPDDSWAGRAKHSMNSVRLRISYASVSFLTVAWTSPAVCASAFMD